jgi:hypothetical protein
LRRQMMRTPIWFRPTTQSNNISIRGLLVWMFQDYSMVFNV